MITSRFQQVIDILNQAIGGLDVNIGAHKAFWRGVTRDQFVAKKVFGLAIIEVGNGTESNIVKALRGQSPFGADLPNAPEDAQFNRMPDALPPVSDVDISTIEDWIDDGCPQ